MGKSHIILLTPNARNAKSIGQSKKKRFSKQTRRGRWLEQMYSSLFGFICSRHPRYTPLPYQTTLHVNTIYRKCYIPSHTHAQIPPQTSQAHVNAPNPSHRIPSRHLMPPAVIILFVSRYQPWESFIFQWFLHRSVVHQGSSPLAVISHLL